MWEDERESEGFRPASVVALALFCMFDHPDEAVAREKVPPHRFPRPREADIQQKGHRGNEGNITWLIQSIIGRDTGSLPGLGYFCSCGLFRQPTWWEENLSRIQKTDRKTKCMTLSKLLPLSQSHL